MGLFNKLFGGDKTPQSPPEKLPLVPTNELESKLTAVTAGNMPVGAFVDEIRMSKVFVMIYGTDDGAPPVRMKPLVIPSTHGFPGICVFTSPE